MTHTHRGIVHSDSTVGRLRTVRPEGNAKKASKRNYMESCLQRAASKCHCVCWFGSRPASLKTAASSR